MKRKHIGRFGTLVGALILAVAFGVTIAKADNPVFSNRYFAVFGVPERASNTELASGQFSNTLGHGTRAFVAEPGGFVQGDCDISVVRASSGYGACATTANSTQCSGIGEEADDEDNTGNARTGCRFGIPEGGFLFTSFQDGKIWVKLPDGSMIDLVLNQVDNPPNNSIVVIRGLYPDGRRSDRNRTAHFVDLVAGHNWIAQIRPPKAGSNVAFVSMVWLIQQLMTSLGAGQNGSQTNCGDAGCATTALYYVDLNTKSFGAWLVSLDGKGNLAFLDMGRNYPD